MSKRTRGRVIGATFDVYKTALDGKRIVVTDVLVRRIRVQQYDMASNKVVLKCLWKKGRHRTHFRRIVSAASLRNDHYRYVGITDPKGKLVEQPAPTPSIANVTDALAVLRDAHTVIAQLRDESQRLADLATQIEKQIVHAPTA